MNTACIIVFNIVHIITKYGPVILEIYICFRQIWMNEEGHRGHQGSSFIFYATSIIGPPIVGSNML